MKATKYLQLFKPACTFSVWDNREECLADGTITPIEHVCNAPAVAVYVSADEEHVGRFVCAEHAREGEHADGPVFWAGEEAAS